MTQHGSALIDVKEVPPTTPAPLAAAVNVVHQHTDVRNATPRIAVVGLGYVGLPTCLAHLGAGSPVVGVDVSDDRLAAIRAGAVDLPLEDGARLALSLADERLTLATDAIALREADAVVICVPTPVDAQLEPDPRALRAACATVVAHARAGQTLLLTSTTYVGTTREMLVEPLIERGLMPGLDVFVAFAPERINPGDGSFQQVDIPRVVGGVTTACTEAAVRLLEPTTASLHTVGSPEAAELTKLYENTFRAVNLAFANEMATVASHYGIDPVELVRAAATKPYGFLAHYPGPGVGGHCIPVDPYYLLAPLRDAGIDAPIARNSLAAIAERPHVVARRALEIAAAAAGDDGNARVLIVGMAYKPNVADHRESPAYALATTLHGAGMLVAYHDPLVDRVVLPDGTELHSVQSPRAEDFDLAVVATVHPNWDYEWLTEFGDVLDATYRAGTGRQRHLV